MEFEEEEEANLSAAEDGFDGFDPTEDELVLHFLRPQLRGLPPRVAGAVLEADPSGAAPWELLARYGLRDQGHFFAARARRAPSVRRSVSGGSWLHSSTRRGQSVTELGVVVRWCRLKFCFYAKQQGQQRSTGWVMDEYEITDPGCYRRRDEEGEEDQYWVLCRVRDKNKRPAAGEGEGQGKGEADLRPSGKGAVAQARRPGTGCGGEGQGLAHVTARGEAMAALDSRLVFLNLPVCQRPLHWLL